jgi:hypothetical protein
MARKRSLQIKRTRRRSDQKDLEPVKKEIERSARAVMSVGGPRLWFLDR